MAYSVETRCVHGEEHKREDSNYAISYPIYQTASFSHLTPGHNPTGFDYTRESNPTRSHLEETMSSLEYAIDTVAFASGMAAITTVFELFKPGDHIICGEDLYGGVVRLINLVAQKNGYEVEYVDTGDLNAVKNLIKDNTKAIYFETPTNPMMKITDIAAISTIAKSKGIYVIVDNTFMTPYFQNPLKEGADIVVHSGTKYLSGHNDTICGFVCSKEKSVSDKIRLLSKTIGATLSPFDSWLVLRGLKTLALRMERHQENAKALAEWLKEQPQVEKVYYAGSGMISFVVKSKEIALNALQNVKLITFAESLGGTETLLTYPLVQTHMDVADDVKERLGITDKLLRMSVGIENINDIISDLKNALEA